MFLGLIFDLQQNARAVSTAEQVVARRYSPLALLCLCVATGLLGCSKTQEKGTTVNGNVTLDGTPLAGVRIAFVGEGDNPAFASATTDDNGNYQLFGDGHDETVIAGRYRVTFSTFADGDPYADPPEPDTPERCHVNYNESS